MGGGPGGSGNADNSHKDHSPSIKLASNGNKKGRKRQLTDGSSTSNTRDTSLTFDREPTTASHVAMLTPSAALAAGEAGCSVAMLTPSNSYHVENSDHQMEQGYLAPGNSFNNNYQNNTENNLQELGSLSDFPEHHQEHTTETNHTDIVHTGASDLVIFNSRDTGSNNSVASPGYSTESNLVKVSVSSSLVLPDDLRQNLECPVCGRISVPPIMQCRNGHVTCNQCRLKVQSCPMCREIDIDIRNLFAEKAVTFMSLPCEFRTYGCKVEIKYNDKEQHERTCKYRPYICPYIECDHKLAFGAVVDHVSSAHREECRRSDGPEITASMILIGMYFGGDGAWSPRVITCFGKTFFDVALTRDKWLHHWVWLLGEEEEAAHYTYEITAFKGNTKYVYGSEVASLRTSDDEIVSEGKCLSISDAIGRRLRDGDKIRYKLKLMRK